MALPPSLSLSLISPLPPSLFSSSSTTASTMTSTTGDHPCRRVCLALWCPSSHSTLTPTSSSIQAASLSHTLLSFPETPLLPPFAPFSLYISFAKKTTPLFSRLNPSSVSSRLPGRKPIAKCLSLTPVGSSPPNTVARAPPTSHSSTHCFTDCHFFESRWRWMK